MKYIFKKFIILSIFTAFSTVASTAEIREIKPLDQMNSETTKPAIKTESITAVGLMPLEKIEEVPASENTETAEAEVKEDKTKEPEKELTPMEKALARTDIRRLDLSQKSYGENDIVFAKGEDKPFTGEFALFLGDIIESSEAYVDGKLNGNRIWYSDDGNIAMIETYKNDKLEGDQNTYFDDGSLKSKITYKNNKIIAIEVYAENGKLLHKDDLSKGSGTWKTFWNNGQVMEEGKYKNWVKDGTWKRYQEDGTVDSIAVYENGRLKSQTWN